MLQNIILIQAGEKKPNTVIVDAHRVFGIVPHQCVNLSMSNSNDNPKRFHKRENCGCIGAAGVHRAPKPESFWESIEARDDVNEVPIYRGSESRDGQKDRYRQVLAADEDITERNWMEDAKIVEE